MIAGRIIDVALAIVGVAFATDLLKSSNTAAVINSIASGFSNSIKAALGN